MVFFAFWLWYDVKVRQILSILCFGFNKKKMIVKRIWIKKEKKEKGNIYIYSFIYLYFVYQ